MNIFARTVRPSSVVSSAMRAPSFLDRRQPCLAQHGHAGFLDHLVEHSLGDVRLDRIGAAGRRSAFALERLVPVQGLAVAGDEPREVLAGDAADAARIADVHRAESAGSHPAEMPARFDQHDALPHPRRLHRRDDAARRAAVDADVGFDSIAHPLLVTRATVSRPVR